MKIKFISALIIGTALFVGAVLWRVDSFISEDRQSWVESQTRTQVSGINYTITSELKSLQKKVSLFTADMSLRERIPWNTMNPYFAVATYAAQGKTFEVQSFVARESSLASNWTADYVRTAVGELPEVGSSVRYFLRPFQDAQRNRYVGIVFLEGTRAIAVFSSGEMFQSIVDSQRNSLAQFSVVTESGHTVGHITPEYVGTVIKEDPVFKNFREKESSYGALKYSTSGGAAFGVFEKVPESNLLTLGNASLSLAQKGKHSFIGQLALLGVGLMIVAAALGLMLLNPLLARQSTLQAEVQALKFQNNQLSSAATAVPTISDSDIQTQKLEASTRVASSLAHEMSGPLASILGFAQMIIAKNPAIEVEAAAQSIVRESRNARTVLDKLLGYAGEEVKAKTETKLEGPLATALKKVESLLKQKGVKVTQNLSETSPFAMNTDAMSRALVNILTNSIEAMERMSQKQIVIDLFEDTEGIQLKISDKGEGIDQDNQNRIFDPFFTTRASTRHMGLGLSYALGVIKEHKGEVDIQSTRGEGTQIHITLKPEALEQNSQTSQQQEEAAMIATEVVRLPAESEHREEAEASFEAVKEDHKQSPLDVNIESLLDLPDDQELMSAKEESKKSETTEKPVIGGEKLKLRDDSLNSKEDSDKTMVLDSTQGPTDEELAAMNDDLTPVNLVAPPSMAPREQKKSKLADYQVEIRRPGKRI